MHARRLVGPAAFVSGVLVTVVSAYGLVGTTGDAAAFSLMLLGLGLCLSSAWQEVRRADAERLWAHTARTTRAAMERAARAQQSARTADAVVEHLPDPLIVFGSDRQVRRANAAAQAAFGDDLSALMRQPILRAALDRALATGSAQTAELVLTVPVRRDLHATVIALGGPGPAIELVLVLADRTREAAIEQMRADFVANASHELRTPLASLIGFIETLQGPAHDEEQARDRFLAIMADQAARMNRLIDDLLSLSRIELSEHQLPGDRVDVAALTTRLAAAFGPQVAARRIRLDLALEADLPLVAADEDQLAQVLQNLLDNGVKYGRDGGTLGVSVCRTQPEGDHRWPRRPGIVLSVTDDGPGIPRAHLPRLTERFYRVDKGRSRNVGGTGLGLAIVKHIVNRHRGRLQISSEEGHGTTVAIWLPF